MIVRIDNTLSTITEESLQTQLSSLPPWRREQALRYKHLSGRRECTMSYILLLQMLKEEYGICNPPHFAIAEHGKPSLAEHPHIHFNLSHCREAVICALGDEPVGVDIECERNITPSLIRYTMNEEEIRQIEQSDDSALTFLKLWTAKEAVFKLTGSGITDNIKDILTEASAQSILIQTRVDHEKHLVHSIATFPSAAPIVCAEAHELG